MTSLLQLMLFTQALWSSRTGIGQYTQAMEIDSLFRFWIFGMVLAVGGMALAVMVAENRKILKQQIRLHRTIAASLNEICLFDADSLRLASSTVAHWSIWAIPWTNCRR